MKWFYQTDHREVGPLTETALRELTGNGVINEHTLIRREDSTEWQQFSVAFSLLSKTERQSESAVKNQQFKFHCPHCQQKISADASQSGISAQCPTCGDDFVVPQATEVIDPPEPGNDVSDEARSTEVPAPQQASVVSSTLDTRMSNSFSERVKDGSLAMKKGAEIVKEGSKVGWSGVKRRSKQAALRAQIQKLRQIDLRKALHALGKEAFEQGVLATELAAQFHTIRELDSKISEMREKAVAGSGESKMEALKRVSKDTAKASQAKALTLKREHLMTELGREINAQKDLLRTHELSDESSIIAVIEKRIHEKEEEIRGLDDGGKSGRQTLAVAAAIGILAITGLGLFRMIGNNEELVFNSRDTQAIESSGNSIDTSNSSVAQSNGTYRPNSGDRTAIGRFNETYAVTNGTRNGLNDMEILRAAFEATDWSGASSDLEDAVKSFMSVRSGESPASRSKKMEKFSVIMDAY
jgi:transcription elongation factor Elf1